MKFESVPKGLSVEPAAPSIKKGETEAKIMVNAADDAGLGSFTIKVIGHPDKGGDASNDLKVTVDKK